jgi:hypothetical protein
VRGADLLFAILLVGASTLLPESFRNALTVNLVRVAGALLIAASILSTSFVHVPDGHLGQMFRVYGGSSLSEGRIVRSGGRGTASFASMQGSPNDFFATMTTFPVVDSRRDSSCPTGRPA